jgi:hypothetical protein
MAHVRRLTSPPALAILDVSRGASPAELRWHNPAAHGSVHRLPGVHATWYHSLDEAPGSRGGVAGDVERRLRRSITRSIRRVSALEAFVGTERLRLGDGALCEAADRPWTNVSVFAPVWVGRRLYHLMVRGTDALTSAAADHGSVNFVTGSCLFSSGALRVVGVDGTYFSFLSPAAAGVSGPVQRIESSAKLSLYELENAVRLPWLIADMIALLPLRRQLVAVTIDVPRVQYYLYLLDAFYEGLLSPELVIRWFELVDERNRRVTELLRRRLRIALAQARPAHRVFVRRAANMALLEPLIKGSIRSGVPFAVGQMAAALSMDDPLWRLVLRVRSPASYRDLVNLSYVVEQLRGALARRGDRRQLMIAVDSPGETRTYSQTREVVAALSADTRTDLGASLVGLYPLERAFTSDSTGRSDLYRNDPGDILVERSGHRCDCAALVANLYREFAQTRGGVPLLPVNRTAVERGARHVDVCSQQRIRIVG